MMSYNEASQYIEDNTYNKTEKCDDRYYCGECKKTSNWTEYSGGNGIENWSELYCDNCGAGDNHLYADYKDYLENSEVA